MARVGCAMGVDPPVSRQVVRFEGRLHVRLTSSITMSDLFSAEGSGHTSSGPPALLAYDATRQNDVPGWDGESRFVAPVDGTYVFTLTFISDSPPDAGDSHMLLFIDGREAGRVTRGPGSSGRASGLSTTVRLAAGQTIQTYADSDSGKNRHFTEFCLTGMLFSKRRE